MDRRLKALKARGKVLLRTTKGVKVPSLKSVQKQKPQQYHQKPRQVQNRQHDGNAKHGVRGHRTSPVK